MDRLTFTCVLIALTASFAAPAAADVDLRIRNVTLEPKPRGAGEKIVFRASIFNGGDEPSRPSHAVLRILRYREVGWMGEPITVPAIGPRRSFRYEKVYRLPAAGHYVNELTVDSRKQIDETSEDNNVHSLSYLVDPLPDLQVHIRHHIPAVNITVERDITAHVKNVGERPSPPARFTFEVMNHGTKTYQVPALEPGERWQATRSPRWHLGQKGRKRIIAIVDPDKAIREGNERNNRVERVFNVKTDVDTHNIRDGLKNPPPDLRLRILMPATTQKGTRTPILLIVRNHPGQGPAIAEPCRLVLTPTGIPQPPAFTVPELFPDERHEILYHLVWQARGTESVTGSILAREDFEPGNNTVNTTIEVLQEGTRGQESQSSR